MGLPGLGVLLVGALALGAERDGLDLSAVRAQSPIPQWCEGGLSVVGWSTETQARRTAYCVAIGQGYAALSGAPRVALEHAERAAALLPQDASAALLRARGYALLGDYARAWQTFRKAQRLTGFRLDDAASLHQFARAARLAGEATPVEVISAYRQLLSVSQQYADKSWRVSAHIEAALALLAQTSGGFEQAEQVIEELARLADSTQFPQLVRAVTQLLVDERRARRPNEGLAVYPEALRAELTLSAQSAPKLLELDRAALLAFSWEHWDTAQAREQWLAVARATQGPWAAYAEQRARRLSPETRRP
jgi:hypothetical protein